MTDTVGIGMVGAGFLAETRARCYRQIAGARATIRAVVARTRSHADAYATKHGVEHVAADLDALLARPDIDVVDLAVPNLLHRPFAEKAAAAGKHIVCTKPLTAYVGQDLGENPSDEAISNVDRRQMLKVATHDARAMVDAAKTANVRLMYGENWVYAPSITRAAELFERSGGTLLEMRGWECHNGSHSPYSKVWKYTGGGALLRLGAHPLGTMVWLKRREGMARNGTPIRPVAVTSEVSDLTQNPGANEANTAVATGWKDVENWGCAIVQFDDGSRGVAYGSDNMLGGMESKLELHGSNFHLKCNLSPNDMLHSYTPNADVYGDAYVMEKVDSGAGWTTPIPSEDWSSGQLLMCQDFVNAVAENRDATSDGQLGLEVTELVYAAYLSAAEGRRVTLADERE